MSWWFVHQIKPDPSLDVVACPDPQADRLAAHPALASVRDP